MRRIVLAITVFALLTGAYSLAIVTGVAAAGHATPKTAIPEKLTGRWVRPSYGWVLTVRSNGKGGFIRGLAMGELDFSRVAPHRVAIGAGCSPAGTYHWKVANRKLTLTKIHDACKPRVAWLAGTWRRVTPQPPAKVAVADSGFTQVPDANDSGTTISYGLVLVNRSHDQDARLDAVHVTLVDAAGNAVRTFNRLIVGDIPAGATFYMGDSTLTTKNSTVITQLVVSVNVGNSTPHSSLAPPAVTNVRLSSTQGLGTIEVDGEVRNEANKDLSAEGGIYAVYFDKAGKIIGGGQALAGGALGLRSLAPGAQTAFVIGGAHAMNAVQASNVAQAKISVAPDYDH
jgi:hypothetical protein